MLKQCYFNSLNYINFIFIIYLFIYLISSLLFYYLFILINRYASFKRTPFYTYGSVFFGWYVAMMIVLLIPIDITSVNNNKLLHNLCY